jgi:hypothetical protein
MLIFLTACPQPGLLQALRHHRVLIFSLAPPSGANFQLRAAIGRSFSAMRRLWALIFSFALPLGAHSLPCAAIRCSFSALRHCWALFFGITPTSGANSKHCATSHWVQNPSFAPPAIRRKIKASCRQPSGMKSKHGATSHRAQNQSITSPAIGHKIEASRHHPVLKFSIAPPLGDNYQHCSAIGCFLQVLRHHWALIISIAPPLGASFKTIGTSFKHCAVARIFQTSSHLCRALPQVAGEPASRIFLRWHIAIAA